MKKLISILFPFTFTYTLIAEEISLWPSNTLGVDPIASEGVQKKKPTHVKDIRHPRIIPFIPESPSDTAIIICPGGGYSVQAVSHEGEAVAKFLNLHNISAYVLRYRLPKTKGAEYHHPIPVSDALRAIQLLRSTAEEKGIKRIGILGFSAGGHLAASAGTLYDKVPQLNAVGDAISQISARPDFLCLGYPVITTAPKHAHACIYTLLPEPARAPAHDKLSCEKNVTTDTPPTFLFHAKDDKAVVPENSVLFHNALEDKGVSTELFLHETGGHGYGLGRPNSDSQDWGELFIKWLKKTRSGE